MTTDRPVCPPSATRIRPRASRCLSRWGAAVVLAGVCLSGPVLAQQDAAQTAAVAQSAEPVVVVVPQPPAAADAGAQTGQAATVITPAPDLADLKWVARPVIIFADAPQDPRVAQQLEIFAADQAELDERDVVLLVDTDPGTLSALREKLRPRDFMVVLIGKDGQIKYRKPNPVTASEVIRLIDRMPMRQQELSTQRGLSN